ncbi:MAG: hypothetical protein KGH68_00895, partial [Patescibacteria group bacterium]|nr:hypothetical protein [Patescibacteria group bacterium]
AGAGTFTFSRNGGAGGFAGRMNGSGIAGTVIAKDSQSITVQAPDGSGSKIVFVNSSTQVFKTDQGSLNDIAVGANVVVAGSANSDGSVTAQSVQIRPARMSTSTPASTSTQ